VKDAPKPDIDRLFREGTEIEQAMLRAGREVRRRHKLLGEPIIVWERGRVVLIPPEKIVVDERERTSKGGTHARRAANKGRASQAGKKGVRGPANKRRPRRSSAKARGQA
jgi:hypothetical protein